MKPAFHPVAGAVYRATEALASGSDTTISGTESAPSKGLMGAPGGGGVDVLASSTEGGGGGAEDVGDGSRMEGGTSPEVGREGEGG